MELIKPDVNIDFVGNRRYAYVFSAILIVLALLSMPVLAQEEINTVLVRQSAMPILFKSNPPVLIYWAAARNAVRP